VDALARRLGNTALDRLLRTGRRGAVPLDARAAAELGRSYDADLSDAKVADNAESHAAARALDAQAFAVGDTVYVGEDAPARTSAAGETLLAHELAHLVQQWRASDVREGVGEPGDQHERSADAAAGRAVRGEPAPLAATGATPAVQRQQAPGALGVAKRGGMSRAEAQQALAQYFQRTLAAQGGRAVRMTDAVKGDIRRIFLNDLNGMLRIDGFLGRTTFPGSPEELAAAIAPYLPDPIDPARLAHLGASPGASPSKLQRAIDVVKETAPYESPESQERQWEFDRQAKELRKKEDVVGPVGVDLQRLYNIGKKLPGALDKPKSPAATETKSDPAVERAIATVAPTALTPAATKGTPAAGEYADAQLVARDLARQLDEAHQRKSDTVSLRLGANYQGVKDRDAIVREVAKLVRLVRDALPHHAAGVAAVNLYFGDRMVQRIPLADAVE
jgi:hypothetical protein